MSDPLIDFPAATVMHGQLVNWAKFLVELESATVTRDQIGTLSAEKERLHAVIDGLKQERDELEAAALSRKAETEQEQAAAIKALADEKTTLEHALETLKQQIDVARGSLANLESERARLKSTLTAVLG